mgnify:CR=1 FL=1
MVVSYYFERLRAVAVGLACCGSGFGTFIFSPLCTYLIEEFGWKQSCYWLAGIILQCCVLGALFRPLPQVDNTESKDDSKTNGSVGAIEMKKKSSSEGHVSNGSRNRQSSERSSGPSRSRVSLNQITSLASLNSHDAQGHQLKQHIALHRKDVFYSGSLQNIPLYQTNHAEYITSNMSIAHSLHQMSKDTHQKQTLAKEKQGFVNSIKELIDFTLLRDFAFLLFLVSNFFTNFSFNTPFLYIPDRAKEFGMDKNSAGWLLSVVGIANIVGRVVFGVLADIKWIKPHRLYLYNVGLVIAGLATTFSHSETYMGQMVYSVFYGVFMGNIIHSQCPLPPRPFKSA